jgi:hypothetical protein
MRLALFVAVAAGVEAMSLAKAEPAEKTQANAAVSNCLSDSEFQKLQTMIKPKPGGYNDVPWMTDFWAARKKAAAEGKPLLVWVGDGHPLGWT